MDDNGNVGIGTSVAASALHLAAPSAQYGLPTGASTTPVIIRLNTSSYGSVGADMGIWANSTYGFWIQPRDIGAWTTYYNLLLNPLGGNVGIGTTAPGYNLQIGTGSATLALGGAPAIGSNGSAAIYMVNSKIRYNWIVASNYNVTSGFEITPSTDSGGETFSTPAFLIDGATGNVGIGAASPLSKLHLITTPATDRCPLYVGNGTTSDQIFFYGANAYRGATGTITLSGNGNGGAMFTGAVSGFAGSSYAEIRVIGPSTNDEGFIRIENGYVGIGTAAPAAHLNVVSAGDKITSLFVDNYSDATTTYYPYCALRRSHNDTLGGMTTTVTGEYLAILEFQGVNNGATFADGAEIYVVQNGTAGTYVPANMYFATCSASAWHGTQLVLNSNGNVGVGADAISTAQLNVSGGTRHSLQLSDTVTAVAGYCGSAYIGQTITATANSDVLYGMKLASDASVGAYTGTVYRQLHLAEPTGAATNYALYIDGGTSYFGGIVKLNSVKSGAKYIFAGT